MNTKKKKNSLLFGIVTWSITAFCFYAVFLKIEKAASIKGLNIYDYLFLFFNQANWIAWLALMIPYSCFFFLVDAHVTWRVVRWFNAPALKFPKILPVRGSAYILALINEQVGKGAISLYLWKRHDVPPWQAVSSMVMLGMMEIYQLLIFSAIGTALYFELVTEASTELPLNQILPAVFGIAAIYFPTHLLYFRNETRVLPKLKAMQIFRTFRMADLKHYLMVVLLKAPNLLGAVFVYTLALKLFNVNVGFGEMLAFLPVIFLAAALPLPFHAGALLLWVVIFPEFPEVGIFSLVMHTFFVLFNASIGVVFLPRANRELFSEH